MIKILMIGPYKKNCVYGGIESVISTYLNSQLNDNFKLYYIRTSSKKNLLIKSLWFIWAFIQYIFFSLFLKINIIHLHSASCSSFYRKSILVLLGKCLNKKICLHIHGGMFNKFYSSVTNNKQKYITKILDWVDIIIVLSDIWYRDIKKITRNKNIIKLYNPIDTSIFLKHQVNKDDGIIKVLFMGKLSKEKGVFDLIEVIPELIIKIKSDIKFILCGNGEKNKLIELCDNIGIRDLVQFPGWVSGNEKIKYYLQSDIFILPSYIEGLPVSIIEAYAAGLPVIATNVGGIPDILENMVNGFIIEPGDKKAIIQKIAFLINKREIRNKMRVKNREKAKNDFDIKIIIKRLKNIYDNISYS